MSILDQRLFDIGGAFVAIKDTEGFKHIIDSLQENIEYLQNQLQNSCDTIEIWRTQGELNNCKGFKENILNAIEYHCTNSK